MALLHSQRRKFRLRCGCTLQWYHFFYCCKKSIEETHQESDWQPAYQVYPLCFTSIASLRKWNTSETSRTRTHDAGSSTTGCLTVRWFLVSLLDQAALTLCASCRYRRKSQQKVNCKSNGCGYWSEHHRTGHGQLIL